MIEKLLYVWRTGAAWRAAMERLREQYGKKKHANDAGVKHDGDKVRMELVPLEAEVELAQLYTSGAVKYDDNNWRKGMKYSRLLGALKRHVALYESGSLIDPETGCHHGAAIMWYGAALVTYDKTEGMSESWNDLYHWQPMIEAMKAASQVQQVKKSAVEEPYGPGMEAGFEPDENGKLVPRQDEAPEFVPGIPSTQDEASKIDDERAEDYRIMAEARRN